jgi:hypothetical protein
VAGRVDGDHFELPADVVELLHEVRRTKPGAKQAADQWEHATTRSAMPTRPSSWVPCGNALKQPPCSPFRECPARWLVSFVRASSLVGPGSGRIASM